MNKSKRIAIIGGGWAGLACAERLLNRDANSSGHGAAHAPQEFGGDTRFEVTLFESAPALGGRARGLTWVTDTGQRVAIDNGQHLTIGAYTETFALLARCGVKDWSSSPLIWSGVTSHGEISQQWNIPDAAWPWRAIAGLLPAHSPKGWPWSWKKSLVASIAHLVRCAWQADRADQTALEWLTQRNIPQELIAHFWQPLIEGALNTEIANASAMVALRVLKDAMAGPAGSTSIWLPPSDLSTNGVDPIARALKDKGLDIRCSHQVLRMHADGALEVRHSDQVSTLAFDAVIMACPHHASLRLWRESALAYTDAQQRWQSMEHRAITTVWVALDDASRAQVSRWPSWFILNPSRDVPHVAQVVVKRSDVIAFVISAQHRSAPWPAPDQQIGANTKAPTPAQAQRASQDDAVRDEERERLTQQISAQLDLDISALPQKWITEKRATWACTATAPMASADECLGYTGELRIFRAADDLEPGYPATIESAVRSGRRTADTVIKALLS